MLVMIQCRNVPAERLRRNTRPVLARTTLSDYLAAEPRRMARAANACRDAQGSSTGTAIRTCRRPWDRTTA
jgi:hypothetical protein